MRQICMTCQRTGEDSNLLCAQPDCPARTVRVWNSGQLIGDVKIVEPFHITSTAGYYRALRAEQPVFLKVAHPGAELRLQYEADIFAGVQVRREKKLKPGGFSRLLNLLIFPMIMRRMRPVHDPFPTFPVLLPAYADAVLPRYSCGMTTIAGERIHYAVFDYFDCVPLSDMLSAVPQPWYQHVLWIMMHISETIAQINSNMRKSHLQLTPDSFFIRTDAKGIPHPVIVDLGMMQEDPVSRDDLKWLYEHGASAYTSPELLNKATIYNEFRTNIPTDVERQIIDNPSQDVYGLGLLFYEMLAGRPAYQHARQTKEAVRNSVIDRAVQPAQIARDDIPRADQLIPIINRAIEPKPENRAPATPRQFHQQIAAVFKNAPPPRYYTPPTFEMQMWRVGTGLIIVTTLVLLVLVLLAQ